MSSCFGDCVDLRDRLLHYLLQILVKRPDDIFYALTAGWLLAPVGVVPNHLTGLLVDQLQMERNVGRDLGIVNFAEFAEFAAHEVITSGVTRRFQHTAIMARGAGGVHQGVPYD